MAVTSARQCIRFATTAQSKLRSCIQVLDAAQYRGKRLTFRAAVRVDDTLGRVARLLVRVHRNDCSTSFRDEDGEPSDHCGRMGLL
jgi:hypothetical protein